MIIFLQLYINIDYDIQVGVMVKRTPPCVACKYT